MTGNDGYLMWGEGWPFPDPREYIDDTDNPVWVIGGELTKELLWWAYHSGYFPWFDFREDHVQWCAPTVRFVIKPEEIHVSHSMRNLINRNLYEVTFDTDFEGIIRRCAIGSHFETDRRDREGAWLGEQMINLYLDIYRKGGLGPEDYRLKAHSVEVRDRATGEIVGGLYGIEAGYVFVGESMFSARPDTSKLALITLARRLANAHGSYLIDCQMPTPHLTTMGARPLPFDDYLRYLWGAN